MDSVGSGLSLYTSKIICQQSGGDIKVQSQEGLGSSFIFWIKVETVPRWEAQELYQNQHNLSQPQTRPNTSTIFAMSNNDISEYASALNQ